MVRNVLKTSASKLKNRCWSCFGVSAPRTATQNIQVCLSPEPPPDGRVANPVRFSRYKGMKTFLYLERSVFEVSSVALWPVVPVPDAGSSYWKVWLDSKSSDLLTGQNFRRVAERMRQVPTATQEGRSQVSVQSTLTSKEKMWRLLPNSKEFTTNLV